MACDIPAPRINETVVFLFFFKKKKDVWWIKLPLYENSLLKNEQVHVLVYIYIGIVCSSKSGMQKFSVSLQPE